MAQGSGLMAACPGRAWQPAGRPASSEYTTDLKSLKTLVLFALCVFFLSLLKNVAFVFSRTERKAYETPQKAPETSKALTK